MIIVVADWDLAYWWARAYVFEILLSAFGLINWVIANYTGNLNYLKKVIFWYIPMELTNLIILYYVEEYDTFDPTKTTYTAYKNAVIGGSISGLILFLTQENSMT